MRQEIFVFGSNRAGIHGAGAAAFALKYKGAEWGVGEGEVGDSYALPTKDENIKTLPLREIHQHVARFLDHPSKNPQKLYMLTPIGCGLAGYTREQMKSMLSTLEMPDNVVLTREWVRDFK